MARLAHIILLMTTGIFLVFPSCPCRLLGLFGIELHDHAVSLVTEAAFVADDEKGSSFPCHCEEETQKTAELLEDSTDDFLKRQAYVAVLELPDMDFQVMTPFEVRRPPPKLVEVPVVASLGRALLGVYRL